MDSELKAHVSFSLHFLFSLFLLIIDFLYVAVLYFRSKLMWGGGDGGEWSFHFLVDSRAGPQETWGLREGES